MKVAIVGNGIAGSLLALQLHQKGYHLTIFTASDKNAAGSASYAAAGMLSSIAELEHADPVIYNLGITSIPRWQQILNTLDEKIFFQLDGSLVTAHPHDGAELVQFMNRIKNKITADDYQVLNSDSVKTLEPELSLRQGYFFPNEGQIDGRQLLSVIAKILTNKSVIWHTKTIVTKLAPQKISVDMDNYSFDWVFDCRGHRANEMFTQLRGVRGESITLHAPDVKLNRPIRLLHPRYRIYIAPKPNSKYIIGASEIESCDDSPISVRSCLELLSAAYSVQPKFAEARIIETSTGIRPALPDNLPRIKHQTGLTAINGLYRHGFLIAPAIIDDAISLFEQRHNNLHFPELTTGE